MTTRPISVYVYSVADQAGAAGDAAPYVATDWPTQTLVVPDIESRDAAAAAFVPAYNAMHGTSLTEADFRCFGPLWATVELREIDEGWEAAAYGERIYRVVHATEDGAKAAWLALWNAESPVVADFPHPFEDANVDWAYQT